MATMQTMRLIQRAAADLRRAIADNDMPSALAFTDTIEAMAQAPDHYRTVSSYTIRYQRAYDRRVHDRVQKAVADRRDLLNCRYCDQAAVATDYEYGYCQRHTSPLTGHVPLAHARL